ncbi:MAG: hypothetical protein HYZ71_15505 [Deltaproteobacteria bacterium]|nr:hypothetical protein [Deltaproteobacteria bacterium]
MKQALLALLMIGGCVHQETVNTSSDSISIRFQNMGGMTLGHGVCSILNYGGLDRLCHYSSTRPVDLFFEVGPGFTHVTSLVDVFDIPTQQQERAVQWAEWQRLGARFYSVDPKDLAPSLELFEAVTSKGATERLSSNLKRRNNEFLFKPYLIVEVKGRRLAFLSLSDPKWNDPKAPWVVSDPVTAFQEAAAQIPADISVLHVVGSIPPAIRASVAAVSQRPVVFFGGELKEMNSREIVAQGLNNFWLKAPDIGRGVGEMVLSARPEAEGVAIGDLRYYYKPWVLAKPDTMSASCAALNPDNLAPGKCALSEVGKASCAQEIEK